MATIYRFIVENRESSGDEGRKGNGGTSKKTTGKKGRNVSLFGGEKGGVEHNRKLRAINPLLNRATSGRWEKGMRLGRAGLGLIQVNNQTGRFAGLSFTAIAILVAFTLQALMKYQAKEKAKAQELNAQNYKMLENGVGSIHGSYSITSSFWTGARTYNQNK